MTVLAVIGGTGLDAIPGLIVTQSHRVNTPYGEPSREIQEGGIGGVRLLFLHRHGGARAIPPHRVNYRANLWALRSLGATQVLGINAVGGINPSMSAGGLVLPDQIIDYTWGREHTVDEGGESSLLHVEFTEPYDCALRAGLRAAAQRLQLPLADRAVHGVVQGPRLETAAEIRRMAADGCDLVGMTGMPEASLAREMGLPYASLCMVVNAAAGLSTEPLTLDHMREHLSVCTRDVSRLLNAWIAA